MNKQLLKEILVSGLLRHTTQAVGGALTYTGIDPGNGLSVDNFATASAGVALQLVAFGWSALRKKIRAKKAAK